MDYAISINRVEHDPTGAVFPEHSEQTLAARINELLRMDCVRHDGTHTNPSGHDAYINHITSRGHRHVHGDIDPTLAELKTDVVDTARDHLRGNVEQTSSTSPSTDTTG